MYNRQEYANSEEGKAQLARIHAIQGTIAAEGDEIKKCFSNLRSTIKTLFEGEAAANEADEVPAKKMRK